jgi:hypothetical protein
MDPRHQAHLVRLICTLLPDQDATYVRSLDPTAYETEVELYAAVRRNEVQLPPGLQQMLVDDLLARLDAAASGRWSRVRVASRAQRRV